MKKIFYVAIVLFSAGISSCKNPLGGIKLYIRNDYYKYTVTLSVQDAKDANLDMSSAIITVGGDNANNIYDRDGNQNFKVTGGAVDFSVTPTVQPTSSSPITFMVNISMPHTANADYIPVTKIVTIYPNQNNQRYTVRMINADNPPTGMSTNDNRSIILSSGGTSKPGYAGSRITGATDSILDGYDVALYIPVGTQFYYYKNNATGAITGTKPSMITHDSTVAVGAVSALYRPVTNYYTQEYALINQARYSQVQYTGSSVSVYMLFEPESSPGYSIYNFGTTTNSVSALMGSKQESQLLFMSAAKKRLIDIFYVAQMSDGSYVTVSPVIRTDTNWFISYELDPTAINPITGLLYAKGDQIETGINYNPSSTYPLNPSSFVPGSVSTLRDTVRMTTDGILRVDCQSTDVGIYNTSTTSTPFSFVLNTSVDTSVLPDPENVTATATFAITLLGSTSYYNLSLAPASDPSTSNVTFSGDIVGLSAPSFVGSSYTVYYWDSSIGSYTITPGTPTNVFLHSDYSGSSYFKNTIRFYCTLECPAAGTDRILEPTLNGSITVNSGGVNYTGNCNLVSGYWKTRHWALGTASGVMHGTACGKTYSFPPAPITLAPFNYIASSDANICNCYFH